MSEALKRTLAELVAIDSTSAKSNAPMIAVIEKRLKAAGFECRRELYKDDVGAEKINLVARRGAAGGIADLALVGHTDCVPFDVTWTDALRLTERDGKLYGRGACDTKAFVACAVHAVEGAKLAPGKSLMAIFTADEEIGCLGAKKLAEQQQAKARWAIVGEPTSLRPIRANKGYCLAEVTVRGREGHSAYPESGANAIFRAARFIERLEKRALTVLREEKDRRFEPPYTSVNVGVISGGKAKNIIAGECRFIVEWRPIPAQPVEGVLRMLEEILAELKREEPGYDATVAAIRMDRGYDTPDGSDLLKFLVEETGKPAETVAFGTEGPQLVELGAEPVVIGPGNIQTAHRTGEFVPIDELVRCEELLRKAIARFCG